MAVWGWPAGAAALFGRRESMSRRLLLNARVCKLGPATAGLNHLSPAAVRRRFDPMGSIFDGILPHEPRT